MKKYLFIVSVMSICIGQVFDNKLYLEQIQQQLEPRSNDSWKMVSEDKYSWQNSD